MLKAGKWENDPKGDTKLTGMQYESGDMPLENEGKGKRNDWHILKDLIANGYTNAQIYESNPYYMKFASSLDRIRLDILGDKGKEQWRTLDVTYIFGTTGTGKTRGVMEKYGYSSVYRVTDYAHPFDEYMGQDVVVFEEFRSSLKCSDMLNYLDGYPISLPSRYANRQALWTKVYLISNVPLEEQYPSVQDEQKETWAAFLRRIHSVVEYTKDTTITYDSVEDYFNRGDIEGVGEYPSQEPDAPTASSPIQIPLFLLDEE